MVKVLGIQGKDTQGPAEKEARVKSLKKEESTSKDGSLGATARSKLKLKFIPKNV